MKVPVYTNRFKKELSAAKKQNKDISKIESLMFDLINDKPIPLKNRDHSLSGNYNGCRECHIEPDWLLIYKIKGEYIIFHRTGSHSDLL